MCDIIATFVFDFEYIYNIYWSKLMVVTMNTGIGTTALTITTTMLF